MWSSGKKTCLCRNAVEEMREATFEKGGRTVDYEREVSREEVEQKKGYCL